MAQQYTQVLTQGGFAAKDTFARMAARRVAEREADRQRQIKLQDDVMKNIEGAEEDMKQDPSTLGSDIANFGWKLNDYYRKDFTEASEKYRLNPSDKNLKAMQAVSRNLDDQLKKLNSIKSKIEFMNEKGADEVLDAPIMNGFRGFKNNIASYVEAYDPTTGKIGDQTLDQLFDELVPVHELNGKVDTSEMFDNWITAAISEDGTYADIVDGMEITKKRYKFDAEASKSHFAGLSPSEKQKKKIELTTQYIQDVANDVDTNLEGYVSVDENGRAYMTDKQMYDYVEKHIVKPKAVGVISSRPEREKELSQTQQRRIDDDIAQLDRVNSVLLGKHAYGDKKVTFGGRTFSLVSIMPVYDDNGEMKYAVEMIDATGEIKNETIGSAPQNIANFFEGASDVNALSKKLDYKFATPSQGLMDRENIFISTIEHKSKEIAEKLKTRTESGAVSSAEDIVATFGDDAKKLLTSESGISQADILNSRVVKINLGKDGKTMYDLGGDGKERLIKDLGALSVLQSQVKSFGVNLKDEFDAYLKNPDGYALDPIERHIQRNIEPSEQNDARAKADELLRQGVKDADVVKQLGVKPSSVGGESSIITTDVDDFFKSID
jgi:uncharacterized protein YnzC (UPF0291/DUF896 family)